MFAELLLTAALAQWTPAEQMKITGVGDVRPSPDGKWAAWTQTRAVIDTEKSEQRTHIWIGATDGSRRFQLTRGDKTANSPRWTADSKFVYFASDREGKRQAFRVPIAGGEAERITNVAEGISQFEISPDGKSVAFTSVPAIPDQEKRAREKLDYRVIDDAARNAVLWVAAAEPKSEAKKLTNGAAHVSSIEWSPDSRKIAYVTTPNPDADDARHSDIWEAEAETGKSKALVATANSESQPAYSPDGRYLAYTTADRKRGLPPTRVALLTLTSGESRLLPQTPNASPQIAGWLPDSKGIYVVEAKGTTVSAIRMPIDGPLAPGMSPESGTVSGMRFSNDGKKAFGVFQSSSSAPEVLLHDLQTNKHVTLSAANANAPKHPLGETKPITWKSKDGREIEGLLTLPVGYRAGTKVPLILNIHGGPSGVFSQTFLANGGIYPLASFASKGYAILRPNPRGSTAYGPEFRQMVIKDWGGRDFEDVTAGAGITNHWSMYGTQDIPSVYDDYFDGPPWEQSEIYLKTSPMTYVGKVSTPTLILHGALDPRVPPSQAAEFYSALKRRGIETQMVTYPRTQHGPTEPKFIQNIMERHLEWVEKHLR
jgi:dipeptidyl aminopeptidase/acylaminoacyl peptidase